MPLWKWLLTLGLLLTLGAVGELTPWPPSRFDHKPQRSFRRRSAAHTDADVAAFAHELGIAPGIVVGRLHNDGYWDWSKGNRLREPIDFERLLKQPSKRDPGKVDHVDAISDGEALEVMLRLARDDGIFAGISTGANVVGAQRLAERLGPDAVIVTLAVDTARKDLSVSPLADL